MKKAIGNRYLFTGKEFDSESGNYYFGARYYDVNNGRWQARDPKEEFFSSYVYCANNPMGYIDPDGERIIEASAGGSITYYVVSGGVSGSVIVDTDVMASKGILSGIYLKVTISPAIKVGLGAQARGTYTTSEKGSINEGLSRTYFEEISVPLCVVPVTANVGQSETAEAGDKEYGETEDDLSIGLGLEGSIGAGWKFSKTFSFQSAIDFLKGDYKQKKQEEYDKLINERFPPLSESEMFK